MYIGKVFEDVTKVLRDLPQKEAALQKSTLHLAGVYLYALFE